MSRTRKATVAAGFGYVQFALALITGIALVPLMLDRLGLRTWGLWLATGELLGYAGVVDLGVLGVLPWILAEADGRQDRRSLRKLLSSGVAAGAIIGFAYALIALTLWQALPSVLRFTAVDRAAVGPALAIVVAVNALTYPLRVFPAALIGLQDMTFYGVLRIVQGVLNALVTLVLLLNGYGLYALAWASVVPTLVNVIASAIRLKVLAPDLMAGWTRPTTDDLSPLFVSGLGVWLASFGWLLMSSSNALVITFLGHPEWVPILSCTMKVSVMFTQLVWLMPDSGLVGLAQLFGEVKATSRVREVVGLLQQVHLLLSGAAACAVVAFNPTFVARWVGTPLYAGLTVNLLVACGIVLYSLVHGLASAASVLGKRVEVGVVTLVNGAVQVVAAIGLGLWLGLPGIALAGLIAACVTSIPACALLLRRAIGLSTWGLVAERIWPWTARMAPIAVAALLVAVLREWLGLWLTGTSTALVLLAYVWHMRPLYSAVLALDPRWTPWLAAVKLVPPLDAGADASATHVALANRS